MVSVQQARDDTSAPKHSRIQTRTGFVALVCRVSRE